MGTDIQYYKHQQTPEEQLICQQLAAVIHKNLPEAESKIWHAHPVWFINGNPIVGYSKLKSGIRLLFWSGVSFEEKDLQPGTGKFKDASVTYTAVQQINQNDLNRWLQKSIRIQWDYKNIVKRKGILERLL
jgi:uncharacterized protein YdhG (YjbR/CyaY superfamily)